MDIHHCWHCGVKLVDTKKRYEEERYFHCSLDCQQKCKVWNYKPTAIRWEKDMSEDKVEKKEADKDGVPDWVNAYDKEHPPPKRKYKCKVCGELGHNARTCKGKK